MFVHTARLQFESKPDKPDRCVRVDKLQELLGGACGEMTVAMEVPVPGPELPDAGQVQRPDHGLATEVMGHVEMIATMVARLLEGAPVTSTTKVAAADPVVGAVTYRTQRG